MGRVVDRFSFAVIGALTCALVALLAGLVSAGPLDPTDPPGGTMKTLQQVEPRTPISSLPFPISSSGSYYLTADLTGVAGQHGVNINADDVDLDLNGFTLRGVPGSLDGVHVTGDANRHNIRVHDGTVTAWNQAGINMFFGKNYQIRDLQVSHNAQQGILASGAIIENVVALSNGGTGYPGISLSFGVVRNSTVYGSGGDGIRVGTINGTVIEGNISSGNGITVTGAGISTGQFSSNVMVRNNQVNDNDYGIVVESGSSGVTVVSNSARGNTTLEYAIAGSAIVGPIVTTTAGLSTAANAYANFDQ